ncbi:AIPR family protein, partial [Streptomyces lunaelactis]
MLRLELFESNVRDYAGSTAVNNAIGETLKSGTGEDFWWFNSRVTVVAAATQIAGKKIAVKHPQKSSTGPTPATRLVSMRPDGVPAAHLHPRQGPAEPPGAPLGRLDEWLDSSSVGWGPSSRTAVVPGRPAARTRTRFGRSWRH